MQQAELIYYQLELLRNGKIVRSRGAPYFNITQEEFRLDMKVGFRSTQSQVPASKLHKMM